MVFNSTLLQLKREIRQLSEIDLWDNMNYEDVKIWLRQFSTQEEQLLGHLIVRNLIVRNKKQMTQLMQQAIRRAISHFIKEEDRYRFNWLQILNDGYNSKVFNMGPVNFNIEGYGKPGKSGEVIMPLLKKIVPRTNFQYPDLYKNGLNAKEAFFMIDDAVLSGNQIEQWIDRYYKDLMTSPDSALVVGIAHEEALKYLKVKLPNMKIFYGELLLKENSFVNLCNKWCESGIWPKEFQLPLDVFNDINKRANFSNKAHLGHSDQALLLAYSYGTPDNTIQILREDSTNWECLVTR
ncbi:hypothetical protein KXJ74_07125 [Acinetobacter johnsonii]|nr:hypothetical protein KXJ74_07125 [Acinetobacter johnsonii]